MLHLHYMQLEQERSRRKKNKKLQLAARGKNQGKGKSKLAYAPKPKISHLPKKENHTKDAICHECGNVGHWKRNCPQYLAKLLKNKKVSQGASTSSIFTIELHTFPNNTWVYDAGCGTHICITAQGLRGSRMLMPRALSLYVGDGHYVTFEAIGSYHLCVPSGLISDVPRSGIFEIDLSNSNTNDSFMYDVSNKRAKINLDSTLLWHCRLGHISKKHIEKLQHDGLLNSTDNQSFDNCVSCMSGKMAQKPYTYQMERAKDLLGLLHIDVCGPFKTVSKQGASYFITFTDDFSRYGYVYLLKHKHEVFETFKVFQKEVENQLGKTIKLLRSNRRGEYMSQEFLDHLKEHGIIVHRTPPYTLQHNGVSERRNRTLLDMVRSMMSKTTLPKSTRTRRAPDRMCLYIDAKENELGDHNEPTNYKAELLNHESKKWLDAMNLFKKKTDMDGAVHTYKARLVAKGFTQTYEVDYEETFSPIADIRANRILVAIAAFYDYEIWQMDVKTAFLNGHLSEEVYMVQHEGNHIPMLEDVKSYLGRCLAMKDLGEAAYIHGIKI
ncbi:retrotransposon protein, putative, ty1-copia subclass [Tanacetum coccineum]